MFLLQKFKRKKYLDRCFYIRPSVFKFSQLLMYQNKKRLCNLALFIREAFKLRTNINIIILRSFHQFYFVTYNCNMLYFVFWNFRLHSNHMFSYICCNLYMLVPLSRDYVYNIYVLVNVCKDDVLYIMCKSEQNFCFVLFCSDIRSLLSVPITQ